MQKLHIIIILISIENSYQLQLKVDVLIMFYMGATYIYIFTNVKNKINYKYDLIYAINNAISNND
jgi:hypothetical protein